MSDLTGLRAGPPGSILAMKAPAPWKKPRPKSHGPSTRLTAQSRARARAAAARAGRRYPNLVDNMNAAKAQKRKAAK